MSLIDLVKFSPKRAWGQFTNAGVGSAVEACDTIRDTLLAAGWSLIGSVENAFDKRYNSEYVLGGFAHAAPPRVWRLDLRYNF